MKVEFSRQIFEKYSYIKCNENPCGESRVVPCGQTDGQADMTKMIVAFRNFANAPKNDCLESRLEGPHLLAHRLQVVQYLTPTD